MLRSIALLLASLATLALGYKAPIEGYGVANITWEVDVWGNGTAVNITGDIEEVVAQAKVINPSYHDPNTTFVNTFSLSQQAPAATVACNPRPGVWNVAVTKRIVEGITYLRGVKGKPTLGPGPGYCSRVSCSWNSAIWWCNDNDHQKTLPDFDTIANAAQVIINECRHKTFFVDEVVGQNFHNDKWNCVVLYDDC